MKLLYALAVLSFTLVGEVASAFNVETHKAMNRSAVENEIPFDSFLRTDAGFRSGTEEVFNGKDVTDWIVYGGDTEDTAGATRPPRHFHNPLRSWETAGLTVPPVEFMSSVLWMQQPQGWSWQEARAFYWNALTVGNTWPDTFQAVGQLMHLVEDGAQPAHVRNDQHLGEFACQETLGSEVCPGNLEYWASDRRNAGKFSFAPPPPEKRFDRNILFLPTLHSQAPVPVARLIDTNLYMGDPALTGLSIGIGEFTNANFFSEDTVLNDGTYPHPIVGLLDPIEIPNGGHFRQYYEKGDGDGIPLSPAAVTGVFEETWLLLGGSPRPSETDGEVWRAEARILVPKAVDYAQGALQYFFRGRIDVAAPEGSVLGRDPGNPGALTKLRVKAKNVTLMIPGQPEETGFGELRAVLRYRGARPDEVYAASAPLHVSLRRQFDEFEFDFSGDPIPWDSANWFVMVVFRGPLGLEQDSVLVGGMYLGGIDIAAPQRYVYGRAPYVAGNSGAFTQLRFNVRNISNEDLGIGQLRAIVEYLVPSGDLIADSAAALASDYSYAVSAPLNLQLGLAFQELTFDFSGNPIPTNSADWSIMTVFLPAQQTDPPWVLAGAKDVFEPDPLDVINASDWDCFNSMLHHVADTQLYPPWGGGSYERDIDGDARQDVFGPFFETAEIYAKAYGSRMTPSAGNFDHLLPARNPTEAGRFFVVQDQPYYYLNWVSTEVNDVGVTPLVTWPPLSYAFLIPANAITTAGPNHPSILYRGLYTLQPIIFVNQEERFRQCVSASYGLAPDLILRDDGIVPP